MFRLGSFSLFGMVLLVVGISTAANPPDDRNALVNKNLSVQIAMNHARNLLMQSNGQKAVEVLEEQLPKVNGNPAYLAMLRDAYRVYIKDLYLAGQPVLAKRYLDRLSILDPQAAQQLMRPQAQISAALPEPEPVKSKIWPKFELPNLFAKKPEEPKNALPLKPKAIRAQADDAIAENPFDPKNQRKIASESVKAQDLLSRGAEEFARKRYVEARGFFEQAVQADQSCLDSCREQWAYCMIKAATDQLDRSTPGNLTELQRQVKSAVQMAPKLADAGRRVLEQIEQRAVTQAGSPPQVVASVTKVKHWGQNREGWQVTETTHFRIFHRQDNDFAERVAQIAESTRDTMYRKWFAEEGVEWEPTCELILHPSAGSYSQMTGVPSNSPGHSRIESDPSGRVISRRMDLRQDIQGMMEAVLPHEATHVVLAGMFGASQVPRWVDEGIAVLSEPDEKIDLHRRNLLKNQQEGHLFALKELMELKDYPQPRRIGAFYAQSVVLVEFLAKKRGPKVFTDFVKDGLRSGYDSAMQRHYELTFAQLEQQWSQQVLSDTTRFAVKK